MVTTQNTIRSSLNSNIVLHLQWMLVLLHGVVDIRERDQTMEMKRKHFYLALMGKIGVTWIWLFYVSSRKIVQAVSEGICRYSLVITREVHSDKGDPRSNGEIVPQARTNRVHGQVEAELWQHWRGTHVPYRDWRCWSELQSELRVLGPQVEGLEGGPGWRWSGQFRSHCTQGPVSRK